MPSAHFPGVQRNLSRRNLALVLRLFALALLFVAELQAMERWAALSQIESGDDDAAIGAAGEVSRYQIKPDLWKRYAKPEADSQDPKDSLSVAQEIMRQRCADFEATYHRAPTDREFYILWNAPARIQSPTKSINERAERFCNLVTSKR